MTAPGAIAKVEAAYEARAEAKAAKKAAKLKAQLALQDEQEAKEAIKREEAAEATRKKLVESGVSPLKAAMVASISMDNPAAGQRMAFSALGVDPVMVGASARPARPEAPTSDALKPRARLHEF